MKYRPICLVLPLYGALLPPATSTGQQTAGLDRDASFQPLPFRVELQEVVSHDDGKFLWFHPRVAPLPGYGAAGGVGALMTLQKHLHVSDFYSGIYVMRSDDLGRTWSGPEERSELAWTSEPGGIHVAVADVTPGWHAPTGKVLAIGAQVRYSPQGHQLEDQPRSHQTAYAIFDPETDAWSRWHLLAMPDDAKFNFARSACAQWLVEPDGSVLLPFYFGPNASDPFSVTVVRCAFDGTELKYQEHGDEIELAEVRGLVEPSLARFNGRYYLTLRNDLRGYVTAGDDGLHFDEIVPWRFDDGSELGSYNTQQHWLTHSDGLFLAYTRRGANNDHVMRHRAPLFLAQVDPALLSVVRATEQVLVPERGATLGNFGAEAIDSHQSWVTVGEGVWNDDIRRRGAKGTVFLARILWSIPNRLAPAR